MPTLKNFVAVDWRAGKDKIYFFFKDINKYSCFDLAVGAVEPGYPKDINAGNWHNFHSHAKHLRFGFTTTGFHSQIDGSQNSSSGDLDVLWLFYYADDIPTVCRYNQDVNKVISVQSVKDSKWHQLLPYFDRIVAGTWWYPLHHSGEFRFLLNDGTFLSLELIFHGVFKFPKIKHTYITDSTYPGLGRYKNRIIGAVQNDQPLFSRFYYIFLTNNECIRYNIDDKRVEGGPVKIDENSWPGLLRD